MPQVNGDNLLHQQIDKRTREALQAQDEAFAIENTKLPAMPTLSTMCVAALTPPIRPLPARSWAARLLPSVSATGLLL